MCPGLRALSAREILRALRSFGFEVVATRGSRAKLRRVLPDGRTVTLTVPLHRVLARGTVAAVYRQALRFVPEEDLRPFFYAK
jgi:predicted RNA binding protein YcfA (HicA-like mRNA interferase family)